MAILARIVRKMAAQLWVRKPGPAEEDLLHLKLKDTEEIFTFIYNNNIWNGKDSVSGRGSDLDQTKIITQELSDFFKSFDGKTILDIPCGDYYWMKNVNLNNLDYVGADIVDDLTRKNIEKYSKDGVTFKRLNLIRDPLPKMDLIFCRDCLVHFSFADILLALENICNSQSAYILTTSFIDEKENEDILTGQWRPLNLEAAPFNLPKPLKIINEVCTEISAKDNNVYLDKVLALWKISSIREALASNSLSKHLTPH